MNLRFRLRTRLLVSHIAIALICVGLISLFSNLFLERQFQTYVQKNIERRNEEIVSQIESLYRSEGTWPGGLISTIGMNALSQGLIVRIESAEGQRIFDARAMDHMLCDLMLVQISENMQSRYPDWVGDYVEMSYPIHFADQVVGTAQFGYYGPFYFDEADLAFLQTLNRVLISVGMISFILAAGLAIIISNRLTQPIRRVVEATGRIAAGHYGDRTKSRSNTIEIIELTAGINHLAETLEQQEILRRRLTADVAHELRTPLSILQVQMEGMIDGIWPADTELLINCQDEILRLQRLVGDLEKLARVESDTMMLDLTTFNFVELIKQQLELFDSETSTRGITLIGPSQMDSEAVMVLADRDKLSQVLVNLLSNAVKYTPEGGKIEVNCQQEAGHSVLVVKDSGIGVDDLNLPHLFERFYRVDPSRNRGTGGAGIGLAICKAIVEAHGGQILIESGGLDRGTTVKVVIG